MRKDYFSDEEYVKKIRSGDDAALDILLNKYKGLVVSEARSFYINGSDFEDVLQEGNIGLCKAVRTYSEEGKASFATYARICIRNNIISAVKKSLKNGNESLNVSLSIEELDEEGELMLSEQAEIGMKKKDPESVVIEAEETETLKKNLAGILTEFEADVLALLVDGCSYREIADKLGKDKKSVDNARSRIKKKLGKIIKM